MIILLKPSFVEFLLGNVDVSGSCSPDSIPNLFLKKIEREGLPSPYYQEIVRGYFSGYVEGNSDYTLTPKSDNTRAENC